MNRITPANTVTTGAPPGQRGIVILACTGAFARAAEAAG